jgi:Predicted ribosomal protein
MIRAAASRDAEGRLLRFEASGHANAGDRGYDIVCAAFSALTRTAFKALDALPGTELRGQAPERGSIAFEVIKPALDGGRAAGIADFLILGIGDLAREYPDAIVFTIKQDWEE